MAKPRSLHLASLTALLLGTLGSTAYAGELDPKMEKMVQGFVKSVETRAPDLSTATLAVFPFQADEKLTKKKVDVAVSEILSHHLLSVSKFKLVERTEIDRILREQKLGLTGAIDSETAVRIGQLLGARLLVLGSVSKLGRSYQISGRVVDAQSGEVVGSEFSEVGVKVFDEEASRYLTLVPERQAIGIYLAVGENRVSVSKSGPTTFFGTGYSLTLTPLDQGQSLSNFANGLGVRYSPTGWLMLDGAVLKGSAQKISRKKANTVPSAGAGMDDIGQDKLAFTTLRLSANYVKRTRLFNGFAGIGLLRTEVKVTNNDVDRTLVYSPGTQVELTSGNKNPNAKSPDANFTNPFVRLGGEWKPQERFGVSVFASYLLGKASSKQTMHAKGIAGTVVREENIPVYAFKMNPLYLEATICLYF